ncbi:3-deoxy-D-manno-octulosonic acid transferase [Calditerrivibrio sp.]|uniref:3-deoxy-D-manno-octulosonic acid transferase n=1 Tax=Calditerrivibrio sp. TaxID=2792612 RepID=UPI003D0D5233
MLSFIYNVILLLLIPIIIPLGYIIAYRKGEYKDYFERIGFIKIDKTIKKSIWIHCASVGEVRSIKTLYTTIRREFPDLSIIISTTTATGKRIAIEELQPDLSILLPIENRWAISYLLDILQCKLFIIVDTEIWPNLINTVHKKIPLILINGRISDRSFKRYKMLKFIFKPLLNKFTKIFTKSPEDTDKFKELLNSEYKLVTLGNIKFLNFSRPQDLGIIPPNKRILVAASTHEGEEELVIDAFLDIIDLDIFDQLIIAPRHLNRIDSVKDLCTKKGLKICTLTKYNSDVDAVIVDRFGSLEYLYSLSLKIFVGGSIVNIGGHNIFEALQFKKVIAIGPHMQNFQEIFTLALKYNVVKVIENKKELIDYLKSQYNNADFENFFKALDFSSREKLKPIIEEIRDAID